MIHSIGLDIGHSAVKVAAGEQLIFPTAATPAIDLALESAREAAKTDTVKIGSRNFFVGDSAVIHTNGRVLDGLTDDWIRSDEHAALMLAGYLKGVRTLGSDSAVVVLGLPSRLYGKQRDVLRDMAAEHLMIRRDRVGVIPQPLAAFMTRTLKADGTSAEDTSSSERWLLVDIGYYTTDFGQLTQGVWSAAGQESIAGTSVAAGTVKRLIANLHNVDLSIRACEEILRTRRVKLRGQMVDMTSIVQDAVTPVAKTIIDSAMQVFGAGTIDSVDGIFVAGGGSQLLFETLKATWPQAICAENPRFAVAEGMRRFGMAKARTLS